MLAGLGLTVSEDHFMDTAMEVIELPREVNLGGLRMQTREPVQVPFQIRVTESQMNPASPMVNRIGSLFYLWGTPVDDRRGEAVGRRVCRHHPDEQQRRLLAGSRGARAR